jgi:glucose dehydrogenase
MPDAWDVFTSSPAVSDGLVYVGSWDSRIYALEARTGAVRWTFQAGLDPAIHNQEGFQSSCACATASSMRAPPTARASSPSMRRQAAFHPVTGDFGDMYVDFYRFTTVGGIMASPAVVDGVVYFGSLDGKLYALR